MRPTYLCITMILGGLLVITGAGYAQEELQATGKLTMVALQADTIVDGTIACYSAPDKDYREYGGFFKKHSLDFRTSTRPQGAQLSAADHVAFNLRLPFPSLHGRVGYPYSAARLLKIEGILTLYVGDSDFLLVQDLADAQKIKCLSRGHYYQLHFMVENVPLQWRQWNNCQPAGQMGFAFPISALVEQKLFVVSLDGEILGMLYRLGQWHLAALRLDFVFEYARCPYTPLIKRLPSPDARSILKAKAARELDKAFSAINAIFSAKGSLKLPANEIHFAALSTALQNIAHYTRKFHSPSAGEFILLAREVQGMQTRLGQNKLTRTQLTPMLNRLRQNIIQKFTNIYTTKKQKSTPK